MGICFVLGEQESTIPLMGNKTVTINLNKFAQIYAERSIDFIE